MCLGIKATTEEVIVRNRDGVWPTRAVQRKTARERWDRSNLEIIVAVPWRKNEDDSKIDGERLKGEVVMVYNDYKEKLEMEEHVPVPKRVYITREDLEVLGFTARCPACMSLLKGSAGQAYNENCRWRIEEELRGIMKAEAAQRRVKEYQDKAAESGTKRSRAPRKDRRVRDPTTTSTTTTSSADPHHVQAAVATQREQAARERAIDPAGWTTTGRQVMNTGRSRTRRRAVDEDGGKQAEDNRRRGREHVET